MAEAKELVVNGRYVERADLSTASVPAVLPPDPDELVSFGDVAREVGCAWGTVRNRGEWLRIVVLDANGLGFIRRRDVERIRNYTRPDVESEQHGPAVKLTRERETIEIATPAEQPGETRRIDLRSGGTLTFTAVVRWFDLSKEDRDLVFKLKDLLDNYAVGDR